MGHYYSEVRSGKQVERVCSDCGHTKMVDVEIFVSTHNCAAVLRKRIEALEARIVALETTPADGCKALS